MTSPVGQAGATERGSNLTNGRYNPAWFRIVRQVVLFSLGVYVIIYALVTSGHDIPFLVTGLVLVGIIPIEDALIRWATDRRKE
jgi:hypothetical protein